MLNGLFKLTSQELEVLNLLIEKDKVSPCSKKARRLVSEEMKFVSPVVVSNYIKLLRDKQAILKTTDGYAFNPLLLPSEDQNSIEVIWEQS